MQIQATPTGFSVHAFDKTWLECPVFIAVDADGQRDEDERFLPLLAYQKSEQNGLTVHTWHTCSSLWKHKEYVLEVQKHAARFFVRVEGQGAVDALRFFGNGAHYEAAGYLLPMPNHFDYTRNLRMSNEAGEIGLGYFSPPSYVYPFYLPECEGWLGVGLIARAGQYNFDQFHYRPAGGRCAFELPLNGQMQVDGLWESQSVLFIEGVDAYDVVRAYADWHYESGWCARKDRTNEPAWWKKPIFCSWGEQGALHRKYALGKQGNYARQVDLEFMMDKLDEYQLNPGTIIIDAKWQQSYGYQLPNREIWPDMRAFVDKQHARGRRVLLWFRSWYPEGLTQEECIDYLCTACAADPTSEKYRARMKNTLHTLLSSDEGCMNCDGFKIDFSNCMPLGKYVTCHEKGVYGVELLKRFFLMMRDFSKAAKEDALINCSCGHPYFDEIVDQCRIHDYNGQAMRNCPEVMWHRTRLAQAVMRDVLIDTDSGGVGSRRDFIRWIKEQPKMGIPDLYYLTSQGKVPFDEEDIALIRETWAQYEARL